MSDLRYIVNVEAVIYRDDKYLIIKRSDREEHAPGISSNAGGKVEIKKPQKEVLEKTLIREIKEEVEQVYWISYDEIMDNKEIEDWLKDTIRKAEKFLKKSEVKL